MFKVGDKVEIIGGKIHYFDIGEVATVKGVYRDDRLYVEGRINQTVNFADVKLVTASPVRETTIIKKEIIPGVYGKVVVRTWEADTVFDCSISMSHTNKKSELAEAIKTLQLIHDAME